MLSIIMLIRGILELPKAIRPIDSQASVSKQLHISPLPSIIRQYRFCQLPEPQTFDDITTCGCNDRLQSADLTSVTIRPKRVSGASINSSYSCGQSLKQIESTKNVLSRLSKTLTKLFMCTSLEPEDIAFTQAEMNVLREVLIKKFAHQNGRSVYDFNLLTKSSELLEAINSALTDHKSTKRVEENNKFIYKYTMKYMKKLYFLKHNLKNSQPNEQSFYEHYFKQTAETMRVPLEHFYDPLYKTLNKNPAFKTINNKYLKLIFSSTAFKNEFFEFVKVSFAETYCEMVPNKLNKFFKKLRNDLNNMKNSCTSDELVNDFAIKLQKNRKCKLPWTNREVICAVNQFKCLIYYY